MPRDEAAAHEPHPQGYSRIPAAKTPRSDPSRKKARPPGNDGSHPRRRRHGIAPRPVGLDERQIIEAVRLYEQGDSLATIGKRMGVTAHTVRSRLVEAGVRMRSSYEHLLSNQNFRKRDAS